MNVYPGLVPGRSGIASAIASKEKGGHPMQERAIRIRRMQVEYFDAVVGIDEKVLKSARPEHYELKFEKLFKSREYLPTSLVAEDEDDTVVDFIMGELYMGEYGIAREGASMLTKADPFTLN